MSVLGLAVELLETWKLGNGVNGARISWPELIVYDWPEVKSLNGNLGLIRRQCVPRGRSAGDLAANIFWPRM